MDWKARIESNADICGGRPRVKGTRLTVELLLGLKAAGWTDAQILDGYPHLQPEDIFAVFAIVQARIEADTYLPFPDVV